MADIAEKIVRSSRKKPAPTGIPTTPAAKGASGAALAVVLVKMVEERHAREEKEKMTLKDKLRVLEAFDRDSHLQFRKELENVRAEIAATAKSLDMGVTAYIAGDEKAGSLYVMVSDWNALSMACEAGYKPNYDLPWGTIKAAARDVNAAKAAPKPAEAKPGEPPPVQTANPTKRKGRPAVSNLDKAIKLLSEFPAQDLELVQKWIASKLGK